MISEVFNLDCIEAMKEYPDKYFELAIVDPPYGIDGNSYRENKSRGKLAKSKDYHSALWDQPVPDSIYFKELMRISKNQIIWGANHFIDLIPFRSSCWIVWDKQNDGTDFADCELAWTSFKTSVRRFTFKWSGMLQGDMKNKEQRIHPTQKPVALYKWLLKNYAICSECDGTGRLIDDDFTKETIPCESCNDLFKITILDTHLGSGSSRIAAYDMGFDFVGYELDKDYFDASVKRFEQYKSQLKLFS